MMKKVALICALVMLVSIVPAFAADTPIKKQTKLQQKAKIQDGTCTCTQNQDQTQTQLKTRNQLKIQDGTCIGNQIQDQIQTKLQKKLKDGSCNTA